MNDFDVLDLLPHEKPPVPGSLETRSLASEVLDIQWGKYFPFYPSVEGTIQKVPLDDASRFLAANWKLIQEEDPQSPFLSEGMSERKKAFYNLTSDFFIFRSSLKAVGVFIGSTTDWGTYYIRYVWIQPQFQRQGLYTAFLKNIFQAFRLAKVERIEVQVSPSNLPSLILYQKLGFNPVGQELTERWGSLTKLRCYLSERHEEVFLKQFCYGTRYQLNTKKI